MKISISYPPLASPFGVPLLSQNRQFQWFSNPTYVYPVIPASAATLLKREGYEVFWDDAIAENKSYPDYIIHIEKENPDLIAIETKTPVVEQHWAIIKDLKTRLPHTKMVLMGDHVTVFPQESLEASPVDYILCGGDYDFQLLNLCNHLSLGTQLNPGFWYRQDTQNITTGPFILNHNLNDLPFIDRDLTKWRLYSENNGNFSSLPGTYTMVGRDCWWHQCTFCSWTTLFPSYRVRSPESLVDEFGILIEKYKVKEIFDDTGTFPISNWLNKFCTLLIERGYNDKVKIGCNMRFGYLKSAEYSLMKKAGFRLLLFGVESANQTTLKNINKNLDITKVSEETKIASQAKLNPHLTIMVGYPWETKDDAQKTLSFAKMLFRKGYASTLQATIVVPYPGTPLFNYCKALSRSDQD